VLKFIIVIAYMVVSKLKALKIPSERGYSYTNAAAATGTKSIFRSGQKPIFRGSCDIRL